MKKLKFTFFISVIFCFGYLTFNLFFSSLSYNVNTPNHSIKLLLNQTSPEGWGFFTKDPREKIIDIYKIDGNNLKKVLLNNGDITNTFGVSRKSRRIGMESSIVLNQLHDSLWIKKQGISSFYIPTAITNINNDGLYYLDRGNYILVRREITPWAWRKNINKKDIPYEVVRIEI